MVEITSLEGKVLVLIATGTNDQGEDETAIFTGTLRLQGPNLIFHRPSPGSEFTIPIDWLERIKPVVPEVKEILAGADFAITLTVTNIEEGEDLSQFESIGLKWPKSDLGNGAA